jgi:hypothetical protein
MKWPAGADAINDAAAARPSFIQAKSRDASLPFSFPEQ